MVIDSHVWGVGKQANASGFSAGQLVVLDSSFVVFTD